MSVWLDGRPVARVGDSTVSGGTIVEGEPSILIDGVPAAVVGSMAANSAITGVVPHVGGPKALGVIPGNVDRLT
jgi:uncharacterized Zn-binding protein involved in type VI secretion